MSDSTETITIRVSKSLKTQLEKTSNKTKVTLNGLINQILTQRMLWDQQLNKMGWMQFEPTTVKRIMTHLNEDQINDVVESSRKGVVKAIEFIYGDTKIEHVVDFIDSWLTASNLPFRHTENSEEHQFFVTHELGKNWSILANKSIVAFVEDLGHTVKKIENKEDSYSTIIKK